MMRKNTAIMAAAMAAVFALTILTSCGTPQGANGKYMSKAVAADEKAMAAEKRPNFASPQVEDKNLKVAGMPEEVTWYTSKPGIWGSTRAKQGGTYKNYIDEFPETFRTVGPNGNGGYRPFFGSLMGLVETNNETREFLPSLATHWASSKDRKTAYYKLNEKAKWSDGTPVTSKDYVFMLEMMRDADLEDPWYNEYYTTQITDVKAYGDYVVAVTSFAEMPLTDLVYNTVITPRPSHFYGGKIEKGWIDEFQWKAEPTVLPYALKSFEKGESLTFEKVKDWWGHCYDYNKYRFNFDKIEYKVITGGNDVLKNYFYNGDLFHFTMIIPSLWADEANAEQIKKGYIDREYAFYVPLQGIMGIHLNTQFPLFSDVNVRKGMYYAINIQKMIDTVLRGEYARFHNIGIGEEFNGINYDDNTIRKPDFDPVKAGELFDKGGYSVMGGDGIRKNAKGKRLSFELIYGSPNHTERLSVLKEEAKKAGVELNLKLQQQGAFTALLEKKYEAYWGGMSASPVPDNWEYFHSSNAKKTQTNNFWGYANPDMDKLLDAFRAEGDAAKKAELNKQIQRKVDEEALMVPGYYVPYYRAATWKFVRYPKWLTTKFTDDFFEPHAALSGDNMGAYFGYSWIDPAIMKEVLDAQKQGKEYEPRLYMDETFKAK